MMTSRLPLLLLFLPGTLPAETLKVGPGEAHVSIQSAIDSAMAGDVIEVAAGLYPENVVITKSPITLIGAGAGTDARGRISGAPDPALESIIRPAAGAALEFSSPAGGITVSGFSLSSPVGATGGVVLAEQSEVVALSFSRNHVVVAPGAEGAAMWLGKPAEDATFSENSFVAAAGSIQAIFMDGDDSFDGLHFLDNEVLRDGAMEGTGLFCDGVENIGPSGTRSALIRGNLFRGHALGFNAGSRSLSGAEISANSFEGNAGGMAAGPGDSVISGNIWKDNLNYGLRLTAFGAADDAGRGVRNSTVEANDFENNGTVPQPTGYGDLIYDDQADQNLGSIVLRRNRFRSGVAVFMNEEAGPLAATLNYWGNPDGPVAGGSLAGEGAVSFEPWYRDEALARLDFGGSPVEGSVTIGEGESIGGESLHVAPAATLTIQRGGSLSVDGLVLDAGAALKIQGGSAALGKTAVDPGATIEVIDGELSLDPLGIGQFHTISGSFSFFNCLGSLHIDANTTFSGDTLGIASDIHVADGVSLYVLGSLVFDGCSVDSDGTFNILVNTGSEFTMTRCDVSGAFMTLSGSDFSIYDNRFGSSAITVFGGVSGGSIYHNVFADGMGALNILPGAAVTTDVEGWANVDDEAEVINRLSLEFRQPLDPTRTLDGTGNLFVQPGDMLDVGIDIGDLADKAQAIEALLGYSTGYLAYDSLACSPEWGNSLHAADDAAGVIGKFDTAVGLGFSHPDPDGTLAGGPVADIRMTAGSHEGRTRVFFRMKADGSPVDNRITASTTGSPYFRNAPFTRNTATLFVDGTAPVIAAGATATQERNGGPLDVLQSNVITRQGTVIVTFDAYDDLAGIDDADARIELVGSSSSLAGALVSSGPVDAGGITYTRYVFEVEIDATAPNGIYDVNAIAMDRSGNEASLGIGALEIQKNRLSVTIEPQGLTATPISRDVVLVATDITGTMLATWTVPVGFSGGTGVTLLEEVPDGTVNLSAKMAWTLRRRLPAAMDVSGQGTVSFSGVSLLRGGDLNGNNIVNSGDYNILASQFPGVNPVADITGNGVVNSGDYNIFSLNWLTAGDPP